MLIKCDNHDIKQTQVFDNQTAKDKAQMSSFRKVIIPVDLENAFADPKGEIYVAGTPNIVTPIKGRLREAKFASLSSAPPVLIIPSLDWHTDTVGLHFKEWGVHAVQGTWSADFFQNLSHYLFDLSHRILKGMKPNEHAYSVTDGFVVFFDEKLPPSFNGLHNLKIVPVEDFFRKVGTADVVIEIWGLAFGHCVKASAIALARLGFKVVVLKDLCASVNPADDERDTNEMEAEGILVTTSDKHSV